MPAAAYETDRPDDVPYGYCWCGCGGKTRLALCSDAKRGHVKGEPRRFVKGHGTRRRVHYRVEECGYDTPCWVWQLTVHAEDGHGRLDVDGQLRMAHRVYYERRFGPLPKGMHLHHRCEVPACVNPEHLEPLTPAEHRQRHSKLTWDDVRAIRAARVSGVTLPVLAERYALSCGHLSEIANGHTWKDDPGVPPKPQREAQPSLFAG